MTLQTAAIIATEVGISKVALANLHRYPHEAILWALDWHGSPDAVLADLLAEAEAKRTAKPKANPLEHEEAPAEPEPESRARRRRKAQKVAFASFATNAIPHLRANPQVVADPDELWTFVLMCLLASKTPPEEQLGKLLEVIRCCEPDPKGRTLALIAAHVVACGGGVWRLQQRLTWPEAERAFACLIGDQLRVANAWLRRRFRTLGGWPHKPIEMADEWLMHWLLFPEGLAPNWPSTFQLCDQGRACWSGPVDTEIKHVIVVNADSVLSIGAQLVVPAGSVLTIGGTGNLQINAVNRPPARTGGTKRPRERRPPVTGFTKVLVYGPAQVTLDRKSVEVPDGGSRTFSASLEKDSIHFPPGKRLSVSEHTRLVIWRDQPIPAGTRLVASAREDGGYYSLFVPGGEGSIRGASLGWEAYLKTPLPPTMWSCSCGSETCNERHRLTAWAPRSCPLFEASRCEIGWQAGVVQIGCLDPDPVSWNLGENEVLLLAVEKPSEGEPDETPPFDRQIAVKHHPRILLRREGICLAVSLRIRGLEIPCRQLSVGDRYTIAFSESATVSVWKCVCGEHVSEPGHGAPNLLKSFLASAIRGSQEAIGTKSFIPSMYFTLLTNFPVDLEERGVDDQGHPVVYLHHGISARLRRASNIAEWQCPCGTFDLEVKKSEEDRLSIRVGGRGQPRDVSTLQIRCFSDGQPADAPLASVSREGRPEPAFRLAVPATLLLESCEIGVRLTANKAQFEEALPVRIRINAPFLAFDGSSTKMARPNHKNYRRDECSHCGLAYNPRWTRLDTLNEGISYVDAQIVGEAVDYYECLQCGNLFPIEKDRFLDQAGRRCPQLETALKDERNAPKNASLLEWAQWAEQVVVDHGTCGACREDVVPPRWCPLEVADHSAGELCLPERPRIVHFAEAHWMVALPDYVEPPGHGGSTYTNSEREATAEDDAVEGNDYDSASE
jgi:hypothetical protein